MKPLYKLSLPLVLLFLFFSKGNAQTEQPWRWGISGGSTNTLTTAQHGEHIIDMVADAEGNTYALANVGKNNLNVDGVPQTAYGKVYANEANASIMVMSFDCTGAYRWAKVIGGYQKTFAQSIEVNGLGQVFVVGKVPYSTKVNIEEKLTHFGSDVTLPYSPDPNTYKKTIFLIRYDTEGNFEQLIMPQAENVAAEAESDYASYGMVADPDGMVHWWIKLAADGVIEGEEIPAGYHILNYDVAGNYLGYITLDISGILSASEYVRMAYYGVSGVYYISGKNLAGQSNNADLHFYINGQEVESTMFVVKFNAQGNYLWSHEAAPGSTYGNLLYGRPQLDNQGNLYVSGGMQANFEGDPVVEFAGYEAENDTGDETDTYNGFPILLKLDPNGTLIWGTHANTDNAAPIGTCVVRGKEVAINGSQAGISWGTESYPYVGNSGYDIYVARFNKDDGSFIAMDSLGSSFGGQETQPMIAGDQRGNFYVAGSFDNDVLIPGDALNNNGPGTEFFIAKYGTENCDCDLPEANFTYTTGSGGVVNYTFTGTANYSDLEWGFGDSPETTTIEAGSIAHTYSQEGDYHVCVTVYNDCGFDTYCQSVAPTLKVKSWEKDAVYLYPNPAQKYVSVSTKSAFAYVVYTLNGKAVKQGRVTAENRRIGLQGLNSGLYLVRMKNDQAEVQVIKLVKN